MQALERRLDVELTSKAVLTQCMDFRDHSARSLAEACTQKGVPTSKATIGHLMSGHTKRTNPKRARAIAEVLGMPLGVLFTAKVSTVQRDTVRTTGPR